MKTLYSIIISALIFINFSCSDENKIATAFSDGEEREGSIAYFSLNQNYPNPFNPSTIISFSIGKRMYIELDVYSEDWVKVRSLIYTELPAGIYQATFDAEGLPSGDYFYIMRGDGVEQIRKMKLVK